MMTKDELITKQQLQIEDMRELLTEVSRVKSNLQYKLHGIGQPMNDNVLGMNNKQLAWCASVEDLIEQIPQVIYP